MEDETFVDRAALVRRRFKRGRRDVMGRSFWEHWRSENCSLLVGMFSTFTILFLEPALWMDNWPEEVIRKRIPGLLALSLLLILPFHGWFLDRFISSKTPGDANFPRWLLGLRFLVSSLPLFGLHALSLWKAFLESSVATKLATAPRAVSLDLSKAQWSLPSGLRSRSLYRSGFFFGWIVMSFLPIFVWVLWLAGARELKAWHRPLVLSACILLHLTAGLCMAKYSKRQVQKSSIFGWRRALLLTAPILWIFAIPGMLTGFAILAFEKSAQTSLSWNIHSSRMGVSRNTIWQGIQGRLQQRWGAMPWFIQWRRPTGLSRSDSLGRKDAEIMALYRLKTLLLVLESLSLSAFVSWVSSLRNLVLWTAAILAGVGLAIQGTGLLARLLRISHLGESLGRHPYGRYLLLTQTGLLAGAYTGTVLSQVSLEQLGLLFCFSTALCALLMVFFFLLPAGASLKGPDMVLWGLLYLSLTLLGGIIALQGEAWREGLLSFLRNSVALSFLWSLGLFLALGGWLLRPFSGSHVFDRRLPWKFRAILLFMTLSTALPLGGLAVPFWIYTRHRLWPRYEPLLSSPNR